MAYTNTVEGGPFSYPNYQGGFLCRVLTHCANGALCAKPAERRAAPRTRRLVRMGLRVEPERGRVKAVPLSRWSGTVVEDVSQVSVAGRAQDLRAPHKEQDTILLGSDVVLFERSPEAGPTRTGLVLGLGTKERRIAADTTIDPLFLVVPGIAGEGPLGTLHPGDTVLLGG